MSLQEAGLYGTVLGLYAARSGSSDPPSAALVKHAILCYDRVSELPVAPATRHVARAGQYEA